MSKELSSKFNLPLDHVNSQIEISDFLNKGGKIKHIKCSDSEIGKSIIKAMLNLYQEGYGDCRYTGTLNDKQKKDLHNAFSNTSYNGSYQNKVGMIPEMLLQIYRSFASNSYIKDIRGLQGTTQVAEDYFEILFNPENYLCLFWDARNDISNNPRGAIIDKIEELGKKKWNQHAGLIDKLKIENETKKIELKEKIHEIPNKKVILIVSEGEIDENGVSKYSTYLEFLLDSIKNKKSLIYKTLEEIKNKGDYIPYYIIIQIDNYRKIIKEEVVGDDKEDGRKFINQIESGSE